MRDSLADLPIAGVLDELTAAVSASRACVLQAPPGAGKTTAVPIALMDAGLPGRILMLEPRRVAARAAAERIAELMGEKVGASIGYRMRGESVPGSRLEVITEGILTRMIQSDPDLPGIGCVIFDEFHERALQADLGLALCLELRAALRPDLAVTVMSATLDADPVADLIGNAPVITAQGRSYPVDVIWRDTPLGPRTMGGPSYVSAAADLIEQALAETQGGVLAFLPGQREIERVASRLALPAGVALHKLYGALPFKAQRAALGPIKGRKLVLATSIAETSLTIPDISVVVDCGRARRSRLDPSSGMARLVTERVSRAEATQRTGRAGRVAEGTCYRLWTKGEEGALAAYPPVEIEIADLVPLALELALWGVADPAQLPFLTPPDPGRLSQAKAILRDLGALDPHEHITAFGRRMAAVPAHPRLVAMLLQGGRTAASLAALLEERDILTGAPADMSLRLEALADPRKFRSERPHQIHDAALARVRDTAKRLTRHAGGRDLSPGAALSLAYPDRIGLRRKGDDPRFVLSGGSGAVLDTEDPLAARRLIVAADLDGDRREAKIRRAAELSEAELRDLHAARIVETRFCRWDPRHRRIEARTQERLGALVLSDRHWKSASDAQMIPALLDAVRDLGLAKLGWSKPATALRGRAEWLHARGADMPDMSDDGLMASLDTWLAPWLAGCRSFDAVTALDLMPMLEAMLTADQQARLKREAPAKFTAPTGTGVLIDYADSQPSISIRLQEMFGLTTHPVAGPDRQPLLVHLLSPAGRPLQSTADLPGFWATSYRDVRADMRGRYPKHPWPENPAEAAPTRRAKPRGK